MGDDRTPGRHGRRCFLRCAIGASALAWPMARTSWAQPASSLFVLFEASAPAARVRDAADGFAMGVDEMTRTATLLKQTMTAMTMGPGSGDLSKLRTLIERSTPLAFVTAATSADARRAAQIARAAGSLVFCERELLTPDAFSWMPADADVIEPVARLASTQGLRAWHLVVGHTARDRQMADLVRQMAAGHGAKIVTETTLAQAPTVTVPPAHPAADAVLVAAVPANARLGPADGTRPVVPVFFCAAGLPISARGPALLVQPELWHGSLRRYGATQLNSRFVTTFGRPMTSVAWGHWLAVKTAWESSARLPGTSQPRPEAVASLPIDGQKGVGLRFTPGAPLRQTVYLVERTIDAEGREEQGVLEPAAAADLRRPGLVGLRRT